MPARCAVVDVGSGSTSLAVFEAAPGDTLRRVHQEGAPLKLLRRLDGDHRLPDDAIDALVRTIERFAEQARALDAGTVHIVATSAMRDARNSATALARVRRIPGVVVRLVTGDEEGRLAGEAAVRSLALQDALVVDVGGGSMQLARVARGRVGDVASLPLGALRLSDSFLGTADPPTAGALGALRRHVVTQLRSVPWIGATLPRVVASGGAARALAKVDRKLAGVDAEAHGYGLDEDTILDLYESLSRMDAAARLGVKGLPDHRVDTIVAATLTLSTLLRVVRAPTLTVCGYGLREGVALRQIYG